MQRAGIAMGANLGDRLATLQRALDALCERATPGFPVFGAPVYRSTPLDCPAGSPDFFNTVIDLPFAGKPEELLEITSTLELRLGRVRGAVRNAPRTIDLDLLYVGGHTRRTSSLELPHPRLAERRFVLQPLCEIRPDWIPDGRDAPVHQLLSQLEDGASPLEIAARFDPATLAWKAV